jgi:methylenetetrahydrofolate reductase (NADPH)
VSSSNEAFPVSFEVYPPRSPEHMGALLEAIDYLAQVNPDFISVTFGAGGSTTRDSLAVLEYIEKNTPTHPLAHLTCVGNSTEEATELVKSFVDAGITQFLALRGDLPEDHSAGIGDLPHAEDLVRLLNGISGDGSSIERIAVAAFPNGHPDSQSRNDDIQVLLRKEDAGATLAITQLFFEASEYIDFVSAARAAGVTMPILPGIMPITSVGRLKRVLELTGEKAPDELWQALESGDDPAGQKRVGIEWAANLTKDLREAGAPGIHLYAFNQHETVLSVLEQAGVR